MTINFKAKGSLALAGLLGATMLAPAAWAFGEAGPLNLKEMGGFVVGAQVSEPGEAGAVTVSNQSYVEFALPAEKKLPFPLILVHGGGGQSADWFATVDGRDGWRNYFLAAGIDTYAIDRPGLGRSPSNPTYGPDDGKGMVGQAASAQIAGLAASELWPGAVNPEGEWNEETWVAANITNPGVVGWLATSPGGPYGGNPLARANIVELTEKIGPSVLFAHSAGGASTILAALTAPAGNVKGVLIFESGVDLLNEANRAAATFDPPLAADFAPVDVSGCMMQAEGAASINTSLKDIPFVIIRSEHGNQSDEAFSCAVRQLEQMGVDAKFVSLPANGFEGGGHFMMSDTNSGEIATEILLPIITYLNGEGELPTTWTVVDE